MASKHTQTALICLGIATLIYLFGLKPFASPMPLDFRTFYYVAETQSQGGNVYDYRELNIQARINNDSRYVFPYLYPPPLAFYVTPFGSMSSKAAAITWGLLSTTCIALCLFFCLNIISPTFKTSHKQDKNLLRSACILLLVLPFYNNLKMGQINIIVLMFILASLYASQVIKNSLLAGMLLAPAALIKITPAGLLVFFCLQKQYKVLAGFIAGCLLFVMPTLFTNSGISSWSQFVELLPHTGYGKTIPGLFSPDVLPNFSMAGLISRLTTTAQSAQSLTIVALALPGCALLLTHYKLLKQNCAETTPLLLLPYLTLMVVGSPITYLHHVIYIYPGVLMTAMALIHNADRNKLILLVALWALAILASIDFPVNYGKLDLESPVLTSLNLYALLGLFIIGLLTAYQASPRKVN